MQKEILAETSPLTREDLKAMGAASGPCVTILVPFHTAGAGVRENSVRLRNAVNQVRENLTARGLDPNAIRELLGPVDSLLDDDDLAGQQGQGLAILRSPDMFRYFFTSQALEESVTVADHFYVRPLLSMLLEDRTFYLLALSQKHLRLLRLTDHSSEEVPLPESLPTSLMAFTMSDKPDHVTDNRITAGPSAGSSKGVMFGTGSDANETKQQDMHHFFRAVDGVVTGMLRNEGAPLVLAGVEKEIALYRDVNTYNRLAENVVHGSADGIKGGDLHQRAMEAVEPSFLEGRKKALDQYEKAGGTERTSTSIKEIVKGSYDGRIAFLFVAEGAQHMGNFDETTRKVRSHDQPHLGDEDLVNASVLQTLARGGTVYVMPHNQVPNGAAMAALFRW